MSGGFSPIVNLACHRGKKPVWDANLLAFLPPDNGPAFTVAGSAAGKMLLSECLADGAAKGAVAGLMHASGDGTREPLYGCGERATGK